MTLLRSSNLSSEIREYRPLSSGHALPADRRKQGAGMLTSNAKRIFCENVTRFGTNKCCSNRSHRPEWFIKAPYFWLAWLVCAFNGKSKVLLLVSGRRGSQLTPIVLAVTIHTLPWKMRLEKCPLFSFIGMASSLFFFVFGHGVETSHLGDVSAQELCQAIGDFSLEQVGIDVSAPCTHESNSLDVNTAKHQRRQIHQKQE